VVEFIFVSNKQIRNNNLAQTTASILKFEVAAPQKSLRFLLFLEIIVVVVIELFRQHRNTIEFYVFRHPVPFLYDYVQHRNGTMDVNFRKFLFGHWMI